MSPRPRGSLQVLGAVPGGGLLLWTVAASAGARGIASSLHAAPPASAVLAAGAVPRASSVLSRVAAPHLP
eukprot:4307682-Pyramimonas_sp.AAC.1